MSGEFSPPKFNPFDDFPNDGDFSSFGRPSIGMLPNFDDNVSRESLGILGMNSSVFPRESLGFLSHNLSGEFGRDSLGIINFASLDMGRESMAICNLNDAFVMNPSDISIPPPSLPCSPTARESIIPSKIYSATTNNNTTCLRDKTALSALYTCLEKKRMDNLNQIMKSQQIRSLPVIAEISARQEVVNLVTSPETRESKFLQDLKALEIVNVSSNSIGKSLSSDRANEFNDSVFIEANHLASRIADGSFLDDRALSNDMLDSEREPEDFSNVLHNESKSPAKPNTQIVFKTLDKFLPPTIKIDDTSNSHSSNSLPVFAISSLSSSSYNNSKVKEANDILSGLSAIINSGNQTEEMKAEGRNLLSSLAELLRPCEEDSGHSSIEVDAAAPPIVHQSYEALDLRKAASVEEESNVNVAPLDLSSKSKTFHQAAAPPSTGNRRASISLNTNEEKKVPSVLSNQTGTGGAIGKFKLKKGEAKFDGIKKGPMKAVIPIESMMKSKGVKPQKLTPNRPVFVSKLKKTSTPTNDRRLKPMASSTPESSTAVNPKEVQDISPLARPATSSSPKKTKHRLTYSGSPSKAVTASIPVRRRSLSEKEVPPKSPIIRRSLAGKLAVASLNNKTTTPRASSTGGKVDSRESVLKENKNRPLLKPSLGRKNGKENAAH